MKPVKLQRANLPLLQSLSGSKKGLSLIEMLVAIAIISSTLISLLGLTSFSLRVISLINQTNQANNIAKEIMEQVRNFRDGTSWSVDGLGTVTPSIDYYLQQSGSPPSWQLTQGTETIGIFTRRAVFENVKRDIADDIVVGIGNNDPNTKKVAVLVSWQERGKSHQIELVSYFTNWRQ